MTLFEKIKLIYKEIDYIDFCPSKGTIKIRDDSNGIGEYIEEWNHPTFEKPTKEQLDSIE